MNIIIAVIGLYQGDAIGNEVLAQYQQWRAQGHHVSVFAQSHGRHLQVPLMTQARFEAALQQPDSILLLQYGKAWPQMDSYLAQARCRCILRYHNITPPVFFAPYDKHATQQAQDGLRQVRQWIQEKRFDAYLAASAFNRQDLIQMGAGAAAIHSVPPFHRIADLLAQPLNLDLAERLTAKDEINILMVGRLAPNKNIEAVLQVVHAYRCYYARPIRLHIIGGSDPALAQYVAKLHRTIESLNLFDCVQFCGSVSLQDLHTYYLHSHIFLTLSAHEGFCVPILEAQAHRLPVLGCAEGGAIRDTAGPYQLIHPSSDPFWFAAAIDCLMNQPDYRVKLAQAGYENWTRTEAVITNFNLSMICEDAR